MRTIGKHAPADLPAGDYEAICAYCGCPWFRSQLTLDASGRLCCPPDMGQSEADLRAAERPPQPDPPREFTGLYPALDPLEVEVRITEYE